MEAVAADAVRVGHLARRSRRCACGGHRRVERGVEDGDLRQVRAARAGRPRCRPGWPGCAAAPAGPARGSRASTSSSTSAGSANRAPPCTTRCADARSSVGRASTPLRCTCRERRRRGRRRRRRARRSARPGRRRPVAPSTSRSRYFTDDEPQLRTRTLRHRAASCAWIAVMATVLTMSCDGRAAGQVVDRLAQALQDRADRDRAGRALHRLVGVVAGVEVREDKHGRPAGDLARRAAWSRPRSGSTAASYWIGPSTGRSGRRSRTSLGGLAHLVDVGARCRSRRSSTTASRPAARRRTGPPSPPRRSRCRRAARRSGRG